MGGFQGSVFWPLAFILTSGSQPGAIVSPRDFAISGDIFDCHKWIGGGAVGIY